ncbi:MAG: amino acid adenylation domain-containing protein, partial [Bacteroidales bacterium]|nr:amino acid adenylation domain-containing protein [Bacteroidales bacterium]
KFIKPFDLSQAPLLRVAIVDIKGEDSLLMIDMHHIISDGTSHAILEKEFQTLLLGEELAPLPLQYKDYSEWQNSKEQQELIKDQEQYWLNKFAGEIPVLNLPSDYVRPIVQSHEGARLSFVLSKEETEEIRSFTTEYDLTLYMSLLSVFSILLSKLSGQDDIIVGTPIAGRNHADLENIVGMFINTLSIRNEVKGEESIRDFVTNLKQTVLGAYENQNYQFEDLVDKVSVERDTSRNPIFDVVINLLNQVDYSENLSGLNNQERVHQIGMSKFDLTLTAVDYGEELLINLNYCTQLFKAETIDRFIVYFKQIIVQLARKPEIKISAIDILSKEEKHQLLYEFNNTEADYPKDKTIHQLFEEQVTKNPDRILVSSEDVCITYKELNIRSNQLAWQLKELGVNLGDAVGLNTDRTEELIIGILGILKCGAAYLPLNSSWPKERINFMLSDTCCKILIHGETFKPNSDLKCQFSDINNAELKKGKGENLEVEMSSSDILYIIYTSGTTGIPKGVLTTHSNVSRVVLNTNYLSIKKCDRILQLSSYTFDGSVFDIYGALLNGSSLVMINNEDLLNINQLLDLISKQQISIFFLTTALFNTIVDYGMSKLKDVRRILFGGERISVQHTQKALEELGEGSLVHVYGPTETTVFASFHNINNIDEARETIPIGKPISNTTIYLLDKSHNIVPNGVPGEIYIGGYGNALGYLNNVELTLEKFIDHPYKKGEKLYQTGDLAFRLPNGSIEFLGRIDHQVKIRGFRIELGEIESALLKHKNIKESAVLAFEENNDKYLCAYIVSKEELNHEELRAYVSSQLPDYMVPSYFVEMESLPLTVNGKVNRKALSSPEIKAGDDYVAPSNKIEEKLVEIWSKVLNIEKEDISVNVNFFSIGGHSLKATVLSSNIHKEIGVEFPLREVFLHSTIRGQAIEIEKSTKKEFVSIPKVQEQSNYTLSSSQKRLYLLQQFDLDSRAYNMPYVISLEKESDKSKIEEVFKQLINRHESFRTSITVVDSEPVQLISKNVEFEFEEISIENTEIEHARNKFIKPFDLSQAPLLRVAIVDIKGEDSLLMI